MTEQIAQDADPKNEQSVAFMQPFDGKQEKLSPEAEKAAADLFIKKIGEIVVRNQEFVRRIEFEDRIKERVSFYGEVQNGQIPEVWINGSSDMGAYLLKSLLWYLKRSTTTRAIKEWQVQI